METFKFYKASNIFFKYLYVLVSVVKSKADNGVIVEIFIIMKNFKNEIASFDKTYKYYSSTIDFISIYEKDLDSFLFEHAIETTKEIILWDIIYPQYKDDSRYQLFSEKELMLKEVRIAFIIDLLFSDRDMIAVLLNTKENTRNNDLESYLQNVINITQRKLY